MWFVSSVKCYECSEAENCRICPRSIKLPPPHFGAESFDLYGLSEVLDYKIEVPQIHFEFCCFILFRQIIAENEISAAAHQAGIPPAVTTLYSEKILKGELHTLGLGFGDLTKIQNFYVWSTFANWPLTARRPSS